MERHSGNGGDRKRSNSSTKRPKPTTDRRKESSDFKPKRKEYTSKVTSFSKSEGSEKRFVSKSSSDRKPSFTKESGERREYGSPNRTGRPERSESSPKPFVKRIRKPAEPSDPNFIRLNRYISNAGICSRRDADELISDGKIKVNGVVVTELGTKVTLTDNVTYKGKSLSAEKKVYILMNKPKDCVSTNDDPEARRTVFDLIRNAGVDQLHAVGRLDRNTTGVLLLTNDGMLTQKLTHPRFKHKKIYHVWIDNNISDEHFKQLLKGVDLEDGFVKADDLSFVEPGDRKQLGIEIHTGQNRVIRRLFETLGYKVTRLDRVMFAGLTKKKLPRGEWRFLTEEEIVYLKRITSLA